MIVLILVHIQMWVCLARVSRNIVNYRRGFSRIWPDSLPARPCKCNRGTNVSFNFACVASHDSAKLQLAIRFCYQLFVCHFIFASVLVCLDTWSQRLDLALKQWIRYVARVYLFCIFSGLMSTSHDVRLMSFFPDRKSSRIRHLGFLDFSQKLGNPRVISKEIEA